jgi:Fic family protein
MRSDWRSPPDWSNRLLEAVKAVGRDDYRALIREANEEYLPWHELCYKKIAAQWEPEVAWGAVKLTRVSQMRQILLLDTSHQPFQYWLPESAHKCLHYVDRHFGDVIGSERPEVFRANRERYLVSSLMEEAIASSMIEGAATTRREAKDMLRSGRAPTNRAERMIVNNYRTVERLKKVASDPLTPELLYELHSSITADTLDDPSLVGRLRSASDEVCVADPMDGEVLHVPPPAAELPERVQRMCDFANEDEEVNFVHPVVRAILLHFWLAYDHPFADGNGRTARALFYWYMLRHGYWLVEFLSISRTILAAPMQYRRAFIWSEKDDRDATYFVMFHLRQVRQAIDELYAYLERKSGELQQGLQSLDGLEGLNHRQRALLQHALKHPGGFTYTIESHKNSNRISYSTAHSDLLDLAARGLLRQRKLGRGFVFTPAPDLGEKLARKS